jgi:hypothetical protein
MRLAPLVVLLLLPACRASASRLSPSAAPADDPFAWTVGTWRGARIEAATGTREPMMVRVRPVLGGAARLQELEVTHAEGVYLGLHVVLREPSGAGETGDEPRWVSHYANAVRGRLTPLVCERVAEPSVWRTIAPGRTREARLTEERPSPDRWRREQAFSEDGGATWTVLFTDELERAGE